MMLVIIDGRQISAVPSSQGSYKLEPTHILALVSVFFSLRLHGDVSESAPGVRLAPRSNKKRF